MAFLDSGTLVVANRKGTVQVFKLPPPGSSGSFALSTERMEGETAFQKVASPGSVAVMPLGRDRYDVLVCNNFADQVTRHRLVGGTRPHVRKNWVLLEEGLNLPDGIASSPSARWIAVSNHNTGSVLMYRNRRSLDRGSKPAGYLLGAGYPHGVRFTADSQFVFVADAGSPVVHVYLGIGDDWHGTRDPVTSLRVLSHEAYLRGRTNRQEGGPKGNRHRWRHESARGDLRTTAARLLRSAGDAQHDRASLFLIRHGARPSHAGAVICRCRDRTDHETGGTCYKAACRNAWVSTTRPIATSGARFSRRFAGRSMAATSARTAGLRPTRRSASGGSSISARARGSSKSAAAPAALRSSSPRPSARR